MKDVINYIENNFNNYVDELKDFLKIPSISSSAENSGDLHRAAEFISGKLKDAGMSRVEIFSTEGHPIVYGEWLGAPGKPTVLVYGHYDVMPVDPIDLWDNPPFEPVVKDNWIYGRGTTDDKGQLYTHIKSVEAYFKTRGTLPLNVKFLLEGEEEIGSEHLEGFINENTELLKCDTVMISDTDLYAPGVPTITYALRGLCYMEVEVTGPNRDLHSGTFGGAVANPINVLAEMIARLHDSKGRITIPDFYRDVLKLTKAERENFKRFKFSEKKYASDAGVAQLYGEDGYTTLERTWGRPTLDCNGIFGGYTGKGAKTVLPSTATAKISMRLVPNQDPDKIAKLFTKYIKQIAPKSVKVKVSNLHGGFPAITPMDDPASKAAAKAMEFAFGKKTLFAREGGSIPIVTTFSKKLKATVVLMGLGLSSDNAHSPNEHFSLESFKRGMISSAYFLNEFSL